MPVLSESMAMSCNCWLLFLSLASSAVASAGVKNRRRWLSTRGIWKAPPFRLAKGLAPFQRSQLIARLITRRKKLNWCAMVCVMLGCYYVVVLGWVMKYLALIFTGFLTQVQAGGTELTSEVWKNFATTPPAVEAWMWFVAAVLIAAAIISRGVQGGIEKANKIMIPAVFILLAILLVRVIMLPGAWKGLEYMYHVELVDFTRPSVWLAAFTQAAWSSGAGWGMFHVYFVYAAKDE
ncbi:MAG: sodium-dependent transporter, partial [Clostridia bacterium]|nr:sodium-dependent transporter [Clostridia bacterium]